jgi:hypothetical protein
MKDAVLADYRDMAAEAKQREEVWQSYYSGLKAFLEGDSDAAMPVLSHIATVPAGVRPFEGDVAQTITAALPAEQRVAAAAAHKLMDRAQIKYDAGSYLDAATLLDELRKMGAFRADPALQDRAAGLQEKIDRKEAEAAEVYAKAVAAHTAGNLDQVSELVRQLRRQYAGTRTYRENL